MDVTKSEWYIMDCLWQQSPLTLMQMVEKLKGEVGWSKSTCATMVRRMAEKNLIAYQTDGKTKRFYPLLKKEEVAVKETKDFLKRIYDGSIGMMMSALVEHNDLSEEDISELQEILQQAKEKQK